LKGVEIIEVNDWWSDLSMILHWKDLPGYQILAAYRIRYCRMGKYCVWGPAPGWDLLTKNKGKDTRRLVGLVTRLS
jgi:hypothetical protein